MSQYITVTEAAKYLKVSRRKLSRLIQKGDLVPVKDKLDERKKLLPIRDLDKLKEPSK
jgi:excisionase family DNA binding protein